MENLILEGAAAINGTGNANFNSIVGTGMNNILAGQGGNDVLVGGGGNAMVDGLGNFPELPGIYPDYLAPIIRLNSVGEREAVLARWGLPSLKDQPTEKPNRGTTNVRHPWFDDWKGYLGVEHRCLVPLTRFAEPTKLEDGSSGSAWFAVNKDEPLTFFAGPWRNWRGGRRKTKARWIMSCSRYSRLSPTTSCARFTRRPCR
jgi:putative SOS response-associated peptidase YedK